MLVDGSMFVCIANSAGGTIPTGWGQFPGRYAWSPHKMGELTKLMVGSSFLSWKKMRWFAMRITTAGFKRIPMAGVAPRRPWQGNHINWCQSESHMVPVSKSLRLMTKFCYYCLFDIIIIGSLVFDHYYLIILDHQTSPYDPSITFNHRPRVYQPPRNDRSPYCWWYDPYYK